MHIRFRSCCMTLAVSVLFLNTCLMAEDKTADKVAATVNGEAIYEREISVAAGLGDAIGVVSDKARQIRLERVIRSRIIGQYLKANKIEVTETEIDGEVEIARKNPPSAGCSCCRYPTLEAFMEANYYDMKELRGDILNTLGIDKYLNSLWEKEYPAGEKQEKLIQKERPRLEKEYMRVSHIFFNTFQNPELEKSPDKVRKETKEKALVAWRRASRSSVNAKFSRNGRSTVMR